MTTRRQHSAETRATALALLATGSSVHAVARELDLDRKTVIEWRARSGMVHRVAPQNAPDTAAIERLALEYVAAALEAMRAHAALFQDTEWLRGQNPHDVAVLHGVLTDKVFRLLGALAPPATERVDTTDAGG